MSTTIFVIQLLSALLCVVGTYAWFAEANVTAYLAFVGSPTVQDTIAVLAMSPIFFFLNCTTFIPDKWRDVFRVIAAFFFLNNFELAVCDTKDAFEKLHTNDTLAKAENMTPDAVRITWASFILIVATSSISFVTSFLLQPILSSPTSSNSKAQQKKASRPSSPASSSSKDPLTYSSYETTRRQEQEHTLTITIASPLKLAYVAAAILIAAATGVLISTGDACTHFAGGSASGGGQNQLSQTFPAIAFLLLTGSVLNDARALDIAISMLMSYIVDWQPTAYSIDFEKKMLSTSALLQSAAQIVVLFVFLWGIVESRRRLRIGRFIRNMRSNAFRLTTICWVVGFIGAGMVLGNYTDKSQIWIACFAGFVVPIFGVGAAVFGVESCFVPPAFIGLRCCTHLAANMEGTDALVRSGWILLMVSNFGGCVSAIKTLGEDFDEDDEIDTREHEQVRAQDEGVYEQIRSRTASAVGGDSENNNNNTNTVTAKKHTTTTLQKRDAEEMIEWVKNDSRVFTGFLMALVAALAVRSSDSETYDEFLKAMYLAVLVIISLTGREAAGTVVFLVGASFVTSHKLWFIDNNFELLNLPTFLFAATLWMFLLFNRDHFPYLPMHHAFAQDVESINKKNEQKRNKQQQHATEREYLTNNAAGSAANNTTGYGAC